MFHRRKYSFVIMFKEFWSCVNSCFSDSSCPYYYKKIHVFFFPFSLQIVDHGRVMGAEKRSHLWGGGIECESMKFGGAQHQQRVGCCCCKSSGKRAARQSVEEGKHGVTLSEWLPCLIPPALALGVYTNSLGGEFVHDDLSAITANRDITDPAAGTWDFLYNDFWGTSLLDPLSHKSYRPLTILTFK